LRSRDIKLNLISVILPLFAEATLTRLSNLVTLDKGLAVEVSKVTGVRSAAKAVGLPFLDKEDTDDCVRFLM
jgi:hypothetical protein